MQALICHLIGQTYTIDLNKHLPEEKVLVLAIYSIVTPVAAVLVPVVVLFTTSTI